MTPWPEQDSAYGSGTRNLRWKSELLLWLSAVPVGHGGATRPAGPGTRRTRPVESPSSGKRTWRAGTCRVCR